ncbi:MAG: DNA translocase FtsK 4TM domain-containing protein [Clostridiaceae bacterium]|nr:DNA translocase FtsK 4TM domain-containing protein [Clostridiaceae bacterium]
MASTGKKQTKATAGAKRPAGRPKKQTSVKKTQQKDSFIRAEVILIVSFAISVLLFLSNFKLCGMAGDFLRGMQLGVFGMVGYIFPLLLFVGTCFYMSNKGNPIAVLKLTAVIAAVLTLCGLAQLLFGSYQEGQGLTQFYKASASSGMGGGWLGGMLTYAMKSALGTVGTYLVLIVLFIICGVIITERSFVSVVKKGGDKAYQHAKEDIGRRREIHAERQEEKRRLREEQKVRGVNLDSTKLMEPAAALMTEQEEELAEPAPEMVREPVITGMPESAAAEPVKQRQADLFTGSIAVPPEYVDEDTVPFDVDDEDSFIGGSSGFEQPEEIFVRKEQRTLEEMDMSGFSIPEETKRVVTASGKIIETDTEALQKKLVKKREEAKEAKEAGDISVQDEIRQAEAKVKKEYKFPPFDLLKKGAKTNGSFSEKEYKETAIKLQQTLQNFGVGVTVTNISCGPSVTRYELHPEQGVKVSKIVGLADDIKLSLAAADIRIEAPIPGKSAVGIEVPNKENNMVFLRDLLEAREFKDSASRLSFAVGKDIGGQVVVTDIAKMPHLLIAGATGSGKSVCINTLIMSIIYKSSPEDVKMIMIDPKVVELSVYNGIPHLLIPVVTDPKKASGALNWAVAEMTDRYKKFADYNVRDLKGYNAKVDNIKEIEDENKPKKLPQIVIIVDELADLMMVAPGEVEDSICRLAQLARAAGIHLVIATQRPSVNVITGLIKANVPSRIAFSVSSGVDSRTIIDMNGAEKLLGKGDMLFYPAGYQKPLRVQGAFVSDQEVSQVVEFLTQQEMTTEYNPDIESQIAAPLAAQAPGGGNDRDEYFVQAGKFIIEKEKASIGMLQRMFKIGFNRAARIMDQLSEAGVVGEEEGTKPRKVLMTMEEFDDLISNG